MNLLQPLNLSVNKMVYRQNLPMQSPVLKGFLSYHRKLHMNLTPFKRSPVIKDHLFFVLKVTA